MNQNVDDTAFTCVACAARTCELVRRNVPDYYLRTPFRVNYVQCTQCALVQQHPMPADVKPYYASYPVHASKGWLHERMRRLVLSGVYFDASVLPADTVLLDYGCGDGWYLDSLKNTGLTRLGYEPDPAQASQVAASTGAAVYSDSNSLRKDWKGKIDQIVLHFVLEHVTDLHATFDLLNELLAPRGRIFVVVPNLTSREYRLFGTKWHGFDAPRHTVFPDEQTLGQVTRNYPLSLVRSAFVRFPNTFAGSLAILTRGHFTQILFLAYLPFGILWTWFDPTGNRCFEWEKHE